MSLFWASIHIFNYEVSSLITFASCVNSSGFSDRRLFLVTRTFRSGRCEFCSEFDDCEVSDSSEESRSGRAGWLEGKCKNISLLVSRTYYDIPRVLGGLDHFLEVGVEARPGGGDGEDSVGEDSVLGYQRAGLEGRLWIVQESCGDLSLHDLAGRHLHWDSKARGAGTRGGTHLIKCH